MDDKSTCVSLLRELQLIWDEIGETSEERDKMVQQLEQECLDVYKRKVEHATSFKARLHLQLAQFHTQLANLLSALGEQSLFNTDKARGCTLKEQVAIVGAAVEDLKEKSKARLREFHDVQQEINIICRELGNDVKAPTQVDYDHDLSLKRLDELHTQLQQLKQEKMYRLQKVLEHLSTIRDISSVLALDFIKVVTEVHPSLGDSVDNQSKSISNDTLSGLFQMVQSLKDEKHRRLQKLQELGITLIELWNLMDSPTEEQKLFDHVTRYISASPDEVKESGELALEVIEHAEVEVQRLDQLKISKMKEIVLKRQRELEEMYRSVHIEVDAITSQERLLDIIHSGTDLSELLASMDDQIAKAKDEALSRKEILDKVEKWRACCEEENWLEDYNRDQNRYNAGRGTHKNLKRAEKARAVFNKIPSLVETLVSKTKTWEEERGMPFVYDGVPLLSTLHEYTALRQEREDEKKRLRDHKRVQEQLATEKEILFGSKPSPKVHSLKKTNGNKESTPTSARQMPATPLRRVMSTGKVGKRESSKPFFPLNNVVLSRDEPGSGLHFSETNSCVYTP